MEQTKTGGFLRQRRKEWNLTQEQLAQQLVVSASTSRIASGTVWLIGGGLILLVAHAMSSPRVKPGKKDK
ncbi:MAG: helix-turn-helix domain-containing protein [Clostridiales bacterium]|nr:helix-turn-helix domain-containing protein [Clostridiales bacterium]